MKKAGLEENPAVILNKVSLARNDLISPADLERSERKEDRQLAQVYSAYELFKRRKRYLDFDDLRDRSGTE